MEGQIIAQLAEAGLIRAELLILIPFLWCIGYFLKKWSKFKDEWTIPLIIVITAIIFAILYIAIMLGEGFTAKVVMAGIMQGVFIGTLEIAGHVSTKQALVNRLIDRGK